MTTEIIDKRNNQRVPLDVLKEADTFMYEHKLYLITKINNGQFTVVNLKTADTVLHYGEISVQQVSLTIEVHLV